MKNRFFTWYFLFVKRLFKLPSFIFILLLVPFIMLAGRFLSSKKSGIVNIAVYVNNSDSLSKNIINDLSNTGSLLYFHSIESEEDGRDLLSQKKVDAVWVFPESLENELEKLAANQTIKPVIRVYEREESTALLFAREMLCSRIFPDFSYKAYSHYVRDTVGLNYVSSDTLKSNYEEYSNKIELFNVEASNSSSDFDYFKSPLRGILSVWVVLCGLAASLYFLNDQDKKTFIKVPVSYKALLSLFYHFTVVSLSSTVAFVAVLIGLDFSSFSGEFFGMLLLGIDTIFFCFIISSLCPKKEMFALIIPIILFLMLLLCPVFININMFNFVKYVFPPFYYIQASGDMYFYFLQIIYSLILIFISSVIIFIQRYTSSNTCNLNHSTLL